jgi:hypothetical protein
MMVFDANCIDSINTTDWIRVAGQYTALGGEKFITLGNFHDSLSSTILTDSVNPLAMYNMGFSTNSFISIDDVSVRLKHRDTTTAVAVLHKPKQLLRIVDVLGRESKPKPKPNVPLFYIYTDGTVEKKIVISTHP